VGFRIQEEFETGMSRSSVFRVYEFNDQGIAQIFPQMFDLCLAETYFSYIKEAFSTHFRKYLYEVLPQTKPQTVATL